MSWLASSPMTVWWDCFLGKHGVGKALDSQKPLGRIPVSGGWAASRHAVGFLLNSPSSEGSVCSGSRLSLSSLLPLG